MAGTSTSEIKQEVKEACEIYTNLTNLLINRGYESLLEEIDTTNLSDAMLGVLKVLNSLEKLADESEVRPSRGHQENLRNIDQYMRRITNRPPTPKKLHSRDLHKLHMDEVMGKVDHEKLKNFIKEYQVNKFINRSTTRHIEFDTSTSHSPINLEELDSYFPIE